MPLKKKVRKQPLDLPLARNALKVARDWEASSKKLGRGVRAATRDRIAAEKDFLTVVNRGKGRKKGKV